MLTLAKICHYFTRKQSFRTQTSLDTKLDRCLSTFQLFFYGISNMVGAGIYVLTGHIIKERVGPATNLSFLLSGLISIFTGLCYCEFATLIPKTGSCYTYTYLMMGELPAFIIGWTMIMDLLISLAGIAKGFSGAVNLLSNGVIKNFTDTHVPLTSNSEIWDTSVDLIALLLLFVLFLVTLTGTNMSMNINSFLAMLQLCFLSVIICACFVYGNSKNYMADGGYLPFGAASIFQGAGIAIFAYSGFECLANSAEETKNPKKSIPIALFTSLGVIIVLYVLASTSLSYLVPRSQIDQTAPFIAGFQHINHQSLKWITGIATLLATGASKISMIYMIPRMLYAMAKDGLLFRFLGHVNEKTKVPIRALIVGVLISMILAMFVKIQILADITSMGIIISFIVIGIDLIILRYLHLNFESNKKDEAVEEDSGVMKMRINVHGILKSRKAFNLIMLGLISSIIIVGLCVRLTFNISQLVGIICSVLSLCLVLFFTILLSFYEPFTSHNGFVSPWMPLTPVITILLNTCLLISLPGGTWLRFVVWLFVGLLIYIFYGIRNSNLTVIDDETSELLKVENRTLKEKNVNTETKETTENSENQQNPEKTENLEKTENFENPEKTENLDNPEKTEKTEKTDEMY